MGHRLPANVNGAPLAFGLELVRAGYGLRVSAAPSGVRKSTLQEHLGACHERLPARLTVRTD
jgi:hypothetical protein